MVATKNDDEDFDVPYEANEDNILIGSILLTDEDNILRNNPQASPLASHNYSMIDEGQEEEEKAFENNLHNANITRGSGLRDFDAEDEEFKNAQQEKLTE